MAGFAAIYDVGVGNVDLLNLRIPLGGFLAQSVNLRGREIDHVIGDVLRSLRAGFCDWLEHITQFGAQLCALVFECVIFCFELLEVVLLSMAVRILDRGFLRFVFRKIFLFAFLVRCAGPGFNFVRQCVCIGAAISKNILNCNYFCV